MKINEVSKKTGLSISTIRFYEKEGLIPEKYVSRNANNYRSYSVDIIDYLLMIKTVHSVGFSLREIKEIQKSNDNIISIDTKIELLQEKIKEVEEQKENLNKTEIILKKMLKNKLNSKLILTEGYINKDRN
ncbi:MerR family transcriptional regulator [Clostridium beijerinckii]|jgi:Predicted transcriptional regulators|uniref:MerR family transcriptional regulator n=2 Tax=Clostridium beijerinckii TaxID=1520 RepID=A0AAE2RSZ9_CLOBE|nr:MerR family transcriptional regulator [Clostridium beijerinckii]ABR34188.1 putative transcriptional regulator, MerR family [Clostridium beijerinckii NCIMB 8052]AIU03633.1 MerR family transcriptional regulator [Clostridium beijerinckii ATCC 35702]MBF7811205.1 MerR family transcriptional regulator [Clostridium beijerinckii]NOW91948.1 DNA-binding transcriptional MerR regulator [Clostridium beijerinckii]NRT24510.1 DNA-binding transcriptional MerR regulator [Clostridium beijerinckii]